MSDEQARRVFRRLQALARADYGGNTGALLVVYGIEGFLRRLAASKYASQMTLKGGMLMAAVSARRIARRVRSFLSYRMFACYITLPNTYQSTTRSEVRRMTLSRTMMLRRSSRVLDCA